jgi:glycosyltransferase involved in cell wall biosynthesis
VGLVAVFVRLIFRRVKVIVTGHGDDLIEMKNGFVRKLIKSTIKRSDQFTVVSHGLKEYCVEHLKTPKVPLVASMGVDCQSTFVDNLIQKRQGIVFIGRLIERKGCDLLLQAYSKLKENGYNDRLVIIGDGPEQEKLIQLASQLGILDDIDFLGARTPQEIVRYLNCALVSVMPSRYEGLGLVAVEAIACGCISITSDLPEIQDIFENSTYQFKSGDIEDLSSKIQYVLKNKDKAIEDFRLIKKSVVKKFDWESAARAYVNAISEVTEN